MSVTRREVFEALAATSDADPERTTTVESLAAVLDTDVATVARHVEGLRDCDLARRGPEGNVRVTVTGEELRELDVDDFLVVDAGDDV
jgi:DNA-binding transcriptional ArsR family regulator